MTRHTQSASVSPALALATACVLAISASACGAEPNASGSDTNPGAAGAQGNDRALPYATRVVSFDPGDGAGFGEDALPGVVLGPPSGHGTGAGSLDVLSLGKGGSIVLGFEPFAIVDGDGPDLVVFENPFWPGGDPRAVYAEPGQVSVSEDGVAWVTFPCDAEGDGEGHFAGCAGVTPTEEYDPVSLVPLDPTRTGGDAFDLSELGLAAARFVKVTDVSNAGAAPSAGFDLDAVGLVNTARAGAEP